MGEHAVVYGRPALVAALDLRLRARLRRREPAGEVEIRLPRLEHCEVLPWSAVRASTAATRAAWERYAARPSPTSFARLHGDGPGHLVRIALGETAAYLGETEPPGLTLEVDSDLPVGSGFGSSAALSVAISAGYLVFRGRAADPAVVEALAFEIERRQHGSPSGVDGATVLHGGLLWARRVSGGDLAVERLPATSPLLGRLRVYDTGSPAESTGAVVAAVRARFAAEPERYEEILHGMGETTRGFREQILLPEEDRAETVRLLRAFEAALEELGVVPEPVQRLVRRIEAAGGAAKVSGAGSLTSPSPENGAGSLLVYHPAPSVVDGWDFLRPFRRYRVALGVEGFRVESAP